MPRETSALRTFARSLSALSRRRPLHPAETDFLRREFGESLEPELIRLTGGGQPLGRGAWQPLGTLIQMHDDCFEGGDPTQPLREAAYPVFAHEALHVWQRRHHQHRVHVSVDGLWLGITQGRRAYAYDTSLDDADALLAHFLAGNIEQQGQIWQDFVHSNVRDPAARPAKFSGVAGYVRGSRAR
jgi:hypothetical protein